MSNLIEQRVQAARRGENPYVIARMTSGWLVIGDIQPLPGYCLLLRSEAAYIHQRAETRAACAPALAG